MNDKDDKSTTEDYLQMLLSGDVIVGERRPRSQRKQPGRRQRGHQRGSIVEQGKSLVGYWSEEVPVENGQFRWKRKNRVLCSVSEGRAEARRRLDEILERVNIQSRFPESTATLTQFWNAKFEKLYLPRLKPTGRTHYVTVWNSHIKPFLGSQRLRDIGYETLQELIEQERVRVHPESNRKPKSGEKVRTVKGYSPQTLLHVKNVLSAMFRFAKKLRWYGGELPTEGVEVGEITHQKRRPLNPEQFVALVNGLKTPHRQFVFFLGLTGLRVGEASGLRWDHVNLTDEPVNVEDIALPARSMCVSWNWVGGRYGTLKKSSSVRIVPLPTALVEMLTAWKAETKFSAPEHPVFPSRKGTPLDHHNVASRVLKPLARKLGMPWVSWHCFRHTANTVAGTVGMSIGERKQVFGWTVDRMALHYDHADVERTREGMERLAAWLNGSPMPTLTVGNLRDLVGNRANRAALDNLQRVVSIADELCPYDDLMVGPDGGVAAIWAHPDAYADIECSNDGSIHALLMRGRHVIDSWEVTDVRKAVERVKQHLDGATKSPCGGR